MRALAAMALLILLALPAPHAAAPPAPLKTHLVVISGTLTPGVNQTWALAFDGEPLQKGWVFLLEARVSGSVTAVLALNDVTAKTWTISPPSWYDSFILPQTGIYNLTLSNPGASSVTFSVYFDQSCNCESKFFPLAMHDGRLVFYVDVPQTSLVVAEFNKPLSMTIRVTAALLSNPGGRWPSDFTVLGQVDKYSLRQADPSLPFVRLYSLNVTAQGGSRVYYFVQGLTYDPANDTGLENTARTVAPIVGYAAPPPSPIPPVVLIGIAGTLAVVGVTVWKWPAISERIAARRYREQEPAKGKAGKKGSRNGRSHGKNSKSAPRGGGHGGRGTRTSRGRSRRL